MFMIKNGIAGGDAAIADDKAALWSATADPALWSATADPAAWAQTGGGVVGKVKSLWSTVGCLRRISPP